MRSRTKGFPAFVQDALSALANRKATVSNIQLPKKDVRTPHVQRWSPVYNNAATATSKLISDERGTVNSFCPFDRNSCVDSCPKQN